MTDLWITDDGTYGTGDFGVFDTTDWTEADWQELENASDWQRLSLAHEIKAKYEQRQEKNDN